MLRRARVLGRSERAAPGSSLVSAWYNRRMSGGSVPNGRSRRQLADYRERIRVFLAAVQAGASDRSAAAEANISLATLHRWRTGERPFDHGMRQKVARAHAIRERQWVNSIMAASTTPLNNGAPGDWRAAAWLLERTNPDYAPVSKHEVGGTGGGPLKIEQDVQHTLSIPSEERVTKVLEILRMAGRVPQLETGETNGHGNSNGHG